MLMSTYGANDKDVTCALRSITSVHSLHSGRVVRARLPLRVDVLPRRHPDHRWRAYPIEEKSGETLVILVTPTSSIHSTMSSGTSSCAAASVDAVVVATEHSSHACLTTTPLSGGWLHPRGFPNDFRFPIRPCCRSIPSSLPVLFALARARSLGTRHAWRGTRR